MSIIIKSLDVLDIRFPTSRFLDGSDAMNEAPDYSSTYVILKADGLEGHGLTFTNGRGNDLCVAAVKILADQVVGMDLNKITQDMAGFWRKISYGDSQLRWLGPEKGVLHLATAAIINAVWDLWAKSEGKPVWQLLMDMSPEQLISCLDFTYVTDAITPAEALVILKRNHAGRAQRLQEMLKDGYPAYTTAAGWLGYSEEKMRLLAREAMAKGWRHFKQKVGVDIAEDCRRAAILRDEIGWDNHLMMDANQVWDVDQAVACMRELAQFDPWWIEEPTNPDDVLGHAQIRERIKPIRVATGEHAHNRVMFKQFFQAGSLDFCQLDAARLGGLNEVLVVLLMAAKYKIPVCPHGGGVGLCEYSQHITLFDYVCVSCDLEDRALEYVDHLHEHFIEPSEIREGRYMPPKLPGYGTTMHAKTLQDYQYPHGKIWADILNEHV